MIVEGSLSTKAVLESGQRPCTRLILDAEKHSKDISYIKALAYKRALPIVLMAKDELAALAQGRSHGGVLLECGARKFSSLASLEMNRHSLVLCLEGINDPYNLGMILRSAYAYGVSMVLLDDYDFKASEAIVIKASAGAYERLNISRSATLGKTLAQLKQSGIPVVSCARFPGAKSLAEVTLELPICICVGGEMRGLSRDVLDQSDRLVYLPYTQKVHSALTAVNAASIVLYEIQRMNGGLE